VKRSISVSQSTRRAGRRAQPRRGVAISEFAIVAPLFFLFMFAGIEFATVNTIRSTAHNAAYEACRTIVIPGASPATATTHASQLLSVVGVSNYTVTVNPLVIDDTTSDVTVTVNVPYASNAVFTPWFTGSLVMNSSVTMKTERYGGIAAGP